MNERIFLTVQDQETLRECLGVLREHPDKWALPHVQELQQKVEDAHLILDPVCTPQQVVTMHSRMALRNLFTDEVGSYELVFPWERDEADAYRISVLSPLGVALLGHRRGEVLEASALEGCASPFMLEEVAAQLEPVGEYTP